MHFEAFNDECVNAKEVKDLYLLSQGIKLTRVNLLLNWFPSKLPTPAL